MSTSALLALGVITVSIVAVNGVNIVEDRFRMPPIEVLSAEVITRTVKPGGVLEYRLVVQKNEDCPAEFDILFISDQGDLKTAGTRKGGKFPVGTETLTLEQVLPVSVHKGRWFQKIVGRAKCPGEAWEWPVPHPLMEFEVTDGT